jgi:hypothetical protein
VEPLTPPVAAAVPAVTGAVPAAPFALPPVALLPPKPIPALEFDPAEPTSPGSVAFEQATAKTVTPPNQKPVVTQSFGLLCIVVDSKEGRRATREGGGGSDRRSSTAMKAVFGCR